MKYKYLLSLIIVGFLVSCTKPSYTKLENGVVVSPINEAGKSVKVEVITPSIIRVSVTNESTFKAKESLVVVDEFETPVWSISEEKDDVAISTEKVVVHISKSNGQIRFYDLEGNLKLSEEANGRSFDVQSSEEGTYQIKQVFESSSDEAIYGLGQHQDDYMNYKGKDVDLWQYNLVAVVPFLVSNNNYGILWDSYSRSKFGDPREYQPLSTLKLYNSKGEEGGLTASYFQDGIKEPVVIKEEKDILYENLVEMVNVPEEWKMEKGSASWNGFIEVDEDGIHKFRLYSAGYIKFWVDGKLLKDDWRQCWNPWKTDFRLDLKKGNKYSVKIEWIPDAGVSYLSLKYLSPYDAAQQEKITLSAESARDIDYYYIDGANMESVVAGYRELTGKAPIVPKWALGFWQSRERYKTEEDVISTVEEYRKRNIPLDNIVIDWQYWQDDKWGTHEFDLKRFPDPAGMIKKVHEDLHANVMISVWPKYYEGLENYNIMKEKGFLYMRNIEERNKDWVGPGYYSTFYDAFNKDARVEFWRQINKELFAKGIDAWWLDATEPDIHSNVTWEEKKKMISPNALGSGEEFFNAFSLMQSKGVYEGQRETDPNKRVFILTRSAFAGQQRYGAATWSGDVVTRWSDFKAQISAGLNIAVSGIPYWTTDIGGFAVEKRYENFEKESLKEWREINTRWFQYGAFSPLFRSHGQLPFREIYNIAPENSTEYNSMVFYTNLRYRMMPYIYSLAGLSYHNNGLIMRPLVMDFAEDKKVTDIGDQFLFGPSVMVAPVYEFEARSRQVYLPQGCGWYDLLSGVYYEGGQTISAKAPLEKIPVFVKEGSILPLGELMQYTNEKKDENITICVYTGKDGQFTLYEDESINYNYENGAFTTIDFTYDSTNNVLTIGERNGKFDTMLENRNFEIVWFGKDMPKENGLKDLKGKVVNYNGSKVTVKME